MKSNEPLNAERLRQAMLELVSTVGYQYLKAMAVGIVQETSGTGLPDTDQKERRFINGAKMQRSYELLFLRAERIAATPTRQTSLVQELIKSTLDPNPVVEKEVETL